MEKVEEAKKLGVNFLTLSDRGFESITRVERNSYNQAYGKDIDFAKIQAHDVIINNYPVGKDWLYLNSPRYQKLYGFSARIENLLTSISPDYVIAPHGSEPISKIIIAKCKKRNIPITLFESPFFPDKILLDPFGMHFFPNMNKIDLDWKRLQHRRLSNTQKERIKTFIERWKRSKISKYPQKSEELKSIDKRKKFLFIPGQVPYDANIINCATLFEGIYDMVSFVSKNLPDDWIVIYKPHPKHIKEDQIQSRRNLVVTNGNIHDLIEHCNAILTFSSNVGLEGIMHKKPVIVCGRPHYAEKGLTIELNSKTEMQAALERALNFKYNEEERLNFLHYIVFEYLIDATDKTSLIQRIEESKHSDYKWSPQFAPFTEALIRKNSKLREWLSIVAAYNELSQKNIYHTEILTQFYTKYKQSKNLKFKLIRELYNANKIDPAERQVAKNLAKIDPKHTLRYRLVREFINSNDKVLDVACGCGYGSKILSYKRPQIVLGIDANPTAIKYAKKYFSDRRIRYLRASVNSLETLTCKFSKIVSFETIEHLENDLAFMKFLVNLLEEDGLLFLSSPNKKRNPLGKHDYHVRHYSEEELIKLLRQVDPMLNTIVLYQNDCQIDKEEYNAQFLMFIVTKNRKLINSLNAKLEAITPFKNPSIFIPYKKSFRKVADYIYNRHPKLFSIIHPIYSKVRDTFGVLLTLIPVFMTCFLEKLK